MALGAVEMVMGDTERCPWDMGTFGSLTTRMFGPYLRAAAAEARAVMLRLASEKLGVPRAKLAVADGVVSIAGDPSRKVTYGELAQGRRILRTVGDAAVLRKASELTVMGTSPQRFDAHAKVTGSAQYAGDIRLPGMLAACVLRPPAHGAKLTKLDTAAAAKLPGVTVVNENGLVAVLHADPEAAANALGRIEAKWDTPAPAFDTETVFDHLLKACPAPQVLTARGDVAAARGAATRVFASTFHKGYVAHAPIEPHTAVAEVTAGKVTVWASTQTPFPTRDRIAEVLGLAAEKVRVITPYVGGGFGGKSAGLQAVEAARLAKITGKPVQVRWSRAEEFFFDTFDPAAVVQVASAIDGAGKISLLGLRRLRRRRPRGRAVLRRAERLDPRCRAVAGERNGGPPLRGRSVARAGRQHERVRQGVTGRHHGRRGGDRPAGAAPAQHHGPADARGAGGGGQGIRLEARRRAARERPRPRPGVRHRRRELRGADRRRRGRPRDGGGAGRAGGGGAGDGRGREPDWARRCRWRGASPRGLGYTLAEELRFRGGEILDRNFDTYHVPRFSWVPRIETVLVRNDEVAPQGGGEPAIVPMGGVIANAVFDATGVRFYRLPLTAERVRAALSPEKRN